MQIVHAGNILSRNYTELRNMLGVRFLKSDAYKIYIYTAPQFIIHAAHAYQSVETAWLFASSPKAKLLSIDSRSFKRADLGIIRWIE